MQDLPDTVIEVIVEAIGNGHLIQKQARLCDLAALDAIPTEILRRLKLNHQQAIAISPVTSPRILSKLACSEYEKVRLAVKKNPQRSTKSEIEYIKNTESLRLLSKHENWRVRARVARNLYTPVDVLEVLAYDTFNNVRGGDSPLVRSAAARNPAISTRKLREILNYQDPEVRHAVVKHPQGLKVLLDYCLKPERNFPEQNSLHRILTGMYPEISREQMDDLLNSEDFLDRLAVVCNPNISKDNLEKLTEDKNVVVRQTAAQFLLEKHN